MADNDTRIRLTAVDDVTAKLNTIRNATSDLTGSFTKLGGALTAIGVTGFVAGIGATVKASIDAAASMGDLSQKTGIAVGELTALDYAMRREGVSTEAFGKGIKELSKNLVEAGDATSKTGKLFQLLGVEATAGPRDALLKIADAFQQLPDGATKATLATTLFDKAGQDLIPALNNGAAGIRQIEEEARRLGITFGSDTAKAAKEFSDNIFALKESGKALGVELAEKVLPGLTNVSRAMKEAAQDSGLLKAAWVGLGGVLAEALGIGGDESRKTQTRIRELGEEIARLSEVKVKDLGGGVLDKAAWIQAQEGIKAAREEMQHLSRVSKALEDAQAGKFADSVDRRLAQGKDLSFGKKISAALTEVSPAKREIDSFGQALEALQLKTLSAANGFSGDFAKSVAVANTALFQGRITMAQHAEIMQALIQQQPFYKAGLDKQADALKRKNDLFDEDLRNMLRKEAAENNAIKSIREMAEEMEFEATLIGKTNAEREKAIVLRRLELAGIEASAEEIAKLVDRIRDQVQAQEDLRNQANLWDEIASRGANFFTDLAENGRSAFKNLGQSLKDFAREVIAVFAKRWILQLGASLTGSASLASQAANVGQGTVAGSLSNALSGGNFLSGLGAILPSGGIGAAFSSGATSIAGMMGVQNIGLLSSIGSIASFVPVIGTAIAAVYMLYEAFKDKGENWKGRIGFGSGASAYATDGVFGREGFQYLAGNDVVNRQIQSFMASTRPLDEQINRSLTDGQRNSIAASLAAYNATGARRADGQPAEFAFGKGDETAAQQLTLEYLQQKYGAVFDTIDTTFATFIRDYTGKSEDLLKEIGAFVGVMEGLRALNVNGLDLEGLRGFQRAGETLEQTLQRVGGAWQQFEQLFTTDAERLDMARASIAETFERLAIAIPSTKDEFEALVRGLDLSTEKGREMFDALMAIAPAFVAVTDAAESAIDSISQIARNAGQSLGFGRNGSNTGANIGASINALSNAVQDNTSAVKENTDAGFSGVYGLTPAQLARNREIEEANRLAQAFADVRTSIRDYIKGLDTSEFSILDPAQQLKVAVDDFWILWDKAMKGDLEALSKLTGQADLVLGLARTNYASGSGFVDLQAWIRSLLTQAGNPPGQKTFADVAQASYEVEVEIRDLLIQIRDQAPIVSAAATASFARAIRNEAAAVERL
jgi:hypothetical protein